MVSSQLSASSPSFQPRCSFCHSQLDVHVVEGVNVCSGFCKTRLNRLNMTVTQHDQHVPLRRPHVRASSQPSSFEAGSHCRAVYNDDGMEYEAEVVSVEKSDEGREYVMVVFVGYGNEQSVWKEELKPSKGEEARREQMGLISNDDDTNNNDNLEMAQAMEKSTTNELTVLECQQTNELDDITILNGNNHVGDEDEKKTLDKCWKVGSPCVAISSYDMKEYEGEIVDIKTSEQNHEFCVVRILGYEDKENVWTLDLKASKGQKARDEQMAKAKQDQGLHVLVDAAGDAPSNRTGEMHEKMTERMAKKQNQTKESECSDLTILEAVKDKKIDDHNENKIDVETKKIETKIKEIQLPVDQKALPNGDVVDSSLRRPKPATDETEDVVGQMPQLQKESANEAMEFSKGSYCSTLLSDLWVEGLVMGESHLGEEFVLVKIIGTGKEGKTDVAKSLLKPSNGFTARSAQIKYESVTAELRGKLRQAQKKVSDLLKELDELEVENKHLSNTVNKLKEVSLRDADCIAALQQRIKELELMGSKPDERGDARMPSASPETIERSPTPQPPHQSNYMPMMVMMPVPGAGMMPQWPVPQAMMLPHVLPSTVRSPPTADANATPKRAGF